jgi:hypothetical protein
MNTNEHQQRIPKMRQQVPIEHNKDVPTNTNKKNKGALVNPKRA